MLLQQGNKYIMVMVEINSNAILVEPMKSCKDAEMIRAYDALLHQLKWAGIVLKKHILDNGLSENLKNHIRDTHKFDMELVPLGCHQRNAAEVAIRNFKAHFLSILAGVSNGFPPSLWDWLLPQTKITINLIQQSNATPNVSAYTHLSGPFTTKCCSPRWDATHRYMRKPINKAHGHFIQWTDGISSHHQNTIAHIIAT
jgi:hypothetical protein